MIQLCRNSHLPGLVIGRHQDCRDHISCSTSTPPAGPKQRTRTQSFKRLLQVDSRLKDMLPCGSCKSSKSPDSNNISETPQRWTWHWLKYHLKSRKLTWCSDPTSTAPSCSPTFERFPGLPTKLRRRIWHFSLTLSLVRCLRHPNIYIFIN